jgi:hypothetical protein
MPGILYCVCHPRETRSTHQFNRKLYIPTLTRFLGRLHEIVHKKDKHRENHDVPVGAIRSHSRPIPLSFWRGSGNQGWWLQSWCARNIARQSVSGPKMVFLTNRRLFCAQPTDPHFRPWGTPGTYAGYYDYQGACTMVLFKNADWECHIATKVFGTYSGIMRAACRLPGGATIDVDASTANTAVNPPVPTVKINGAVTAVTATPILVDGYPLSANTESYYYQLSLTIPDGGYIRWNLWAESLAMTVGGTAATFAGAAGMLGSFDADGSLVNRNGSPHPASATVYKDELATEWKVGTADATLIALPGFVETGCTASNVGDKPGPCIIGTIATRRRLTPGEQCRCKQCVTKAQIEAECGNETLTAGQQENCKFDMAATGLTNIWGVQAPWNFEIDDQCTAAGGKCVFECQESSTVKCDPTRCGSIFQEEREPFLPEIIRFGTYRICIGGKTHKVGLWGYVLHFVFFVVLGWWTGWSSLSPCVTACACRIQSITT